MSCDFCNHATGDHLESLFGDGVKCFHEDEEGKTCDCERDTTDA